MKYSLLLAILAALAIAPFASAQVERETEDDEEVTIERDGNEMRIIIEREDDGERERVERRIPLHPEGRMERRGVIVLRDENGEERRIEFDGEPPHHVLRELRGGFDGGEFEFDIEMPDFGAIRPHIERLMDREHGLRGRMLRFEGLLDGLHLENEELRREMMELERRSVELGMQLRRENAENRSEKERELEEALERLFELRGQVRAERADRLKEEAEELRREAEALREALREREAERRQLIEERRRELLGERGSDW